MMPHSPTLKSLQKLDLLLFLAARDGGGAEQVLDLVAQGANPKARFGNGATALHAAAGSGSICALEALLPFGDPRSVDEQGRSPLIAGVNSGRPAVAQLLAPLSDVDAVSNSGFTAMGLAISKNFGQCFDALLPAQGTAAPLARNDLTALMFAADLSRTSMASALMPSSDPLERNADGWTALMFAARAGASSIVKMLAPLSDLDARCLVTEWTAADLASEKGYPEIAEMLWAMATSRNELALLDEACPPVQRSQAVGRL